MPRLDEYEQREGDPLVSTSLKKASFGSVRYETLQRSTRQASGDRLNQRHSFVKCRGLQGVQISDRIHTRSIRVIASFDLII